MAQGTSLPWPRGRTSVMTVHLSICIFVDSCSRAEGALKRGCFSRMAWAREPLVAKNKNRQMHRHDRCSSPGPAPRLLTAFQSWAQSDSQISWAQSEPSKAWRCLIRATTGPDELVSTGDSKARGARSHQTLLSDATTPPPSHKKNVLYVTPDRPRSESPAERPTHAPDALRLPPCHGQPSGMVLTYPVRAHRFPRAARPGNNRRSPPARPEQCSTKAS